MDKRDAYQISVANSLHKLIIKTKDDLVAARRYKNSLFYIDAVLSRGTENQEPIYLDHLYDLISSIESLVEYDLKNEGGDDE